MSAVETAFPVLLSDTATAKVKTLLENEADDDLCLRVFVTGGGCAGFQYGFTFDDEKNEDDTYLNEGGVRVLVDAMSYQYLVGSQVDYEEGLEGSRFLVNNPSASTTCGCGSSFSV
jgi:iron-sulfur cluster insertion protein